MQIENIKLWSYGRKHIKLWSYARKHVYDTGAEQGLQETNQNKHNEIHRKTIHILARQMPFASIVIEMFNAALR